MARYVDADELLKNLKKQYGEELGWQCTVNMSDVGMMIEDAPAADVVSRAELSIVSVQNAALEKTNKELRKELDVLGILVAGLKDNFVDVVRCKDCKHAQFMSSCSRYMCHKVGGCMRAEDDYCNYGERKE